MGTEEGVWLGETHEEERPQVEGSVEGIVTLGRARTTERKDRKVQRERMDIAGGRGRTLDG